MKRLFVLLLLFFLSLAANAQDNNELKLVRLKSGIKVSGYVTQGADGAISVTTTDGDQFMYQASEVASITTDPSVLEARRQEEARVREEAKQRKAQEAAEEKIRKEQELADAKAARIARKNAIQMKESGFQLIVDGGVDAKLLVGEVAIATENHIIPGYRLNKYMFIGVGLGAAFKTLPFRYQYIASSTDFSTLNKTSNKREIRGYYGGVGGGASLFMRINFKHKRITPFVDISAGYDYVHSEFYYYTSNPHGGLEALDDYDGWRMMKSGGCSFGWMFRTRRGQGLHLSIGATYTPALPDVFHYNSGYAVDSYSGYIDECPAGDIILKCAVDICVKTGFMF